MELKNSSDGVNSGNIYNIETSSSGSGGSISSGLSSKTSSNKEPIKYNFTDFDSDIKNEINELYSYSELSILKKSNISNQFYQDLFEYTSKNRWLELTDFEKIDYLQHLIGYFELSIKGVDNYNRYLIKSRFLWYIAQGVKDEIHDKKDQLHHSKLNCILLREINSLPILLKTLLLSSQVSNENVKIQQQQQQQQYQQQQQQQQQQSNDQTDDNTSSNNNNNSNGNGNFISHGKKSHILKNNSNSNSNSNNSVLKNNSGTNTLSTMKVNVKRADLLMSILLDIIYLILINNKDDESFKEEIFESLEGCNNNNIGSCKNNNNSNNNSIGNSNNIDNPNLISIILQLLCEFNEIDGNLYPIKKIIMVLWKSLTIFMGGLQDLEKEKEKRFDSIGYKKGTPKTRSHDISNFIRSTTRYHSQQKSGSILHKVNTHFLGTPKEYKDHDVFRLPISLSKSLSVLKSNLYPPEQIRKEIGLNYYSFNNHNTVTPHIQSDYFYNTSNTGSNLNTIKPRILIDNPSNFERFYCMNVSNFSKIVIILLKILLAATPVVKNYTGPINLIAEIVIDQPSPGSSASLVETMQSAVDFLRHKEIISKSTLGILLLIIKHSKFNQHLQFEYLSKIMYESNALVLLYKCLNHESVEKYLFSQNYLSSEEYFNDDHYSAPYSSFPSAAPPPPQQQYHLSSSNNSVSSGGAGCEGGGNPPPVQLIENNRNFFSTIASLKLIQKVMKHHPSRISSLSASKSANILKKYCSVNHPLVKLYSLKIIKNLVPYQTKKWKQINMRIISDIYLEVPIHINDNWLLNHNSSSNINNSSNNDNGLMTDEHEVLLQEKVEEYHKVNYEQWFTNDGLDMCYKNDHSMGINIFDDLLHSLQLTTEEKQAIENDKLGYLDKDEGSSLIFMNDALEDELLFNKWNIKKPTF